MFKLKQYVMHIMLHNLKFIHIVNTLHIKKAHYLMMTIIIYFVFKICKRIFYQFFCSCKWARYEFVSSLGTI